MVDDDINVYDPFDDERAWVTRVFPERNIVIVKGSATADTPYSKKWGIDATAPIKDKEWYTRAVPLGVDKVDYA